MPKLSDPRESGQALPALEALGCERDGNLIPLLLQALDVGHAGICLCDEQDYVCYANRAFRAAFFPDLPDEPIGFVDAIAAAIASGKGIKLESMPLPSFIGRVKERRRSGPPRYDFTVDLADGSWWWVNDHRLANGWILVVATEISSIKHEEFRLRHEHAAAMQDARTDFLTGLPNRRSGMEHADAALQEFHSNRLPLSVAVIDIDHFKRINDTYGHDVGDAVLLHFAQALTAELGPRDHLSRIGGEEFMITMPSAPASRAEKRLDRLIQELRPMIRGAGRHPIGYAFSAGLASASRSDDLKTLLARADSALYSAKHGAGAK